MIFPFCRQVRANLREVRLQRRVRFRITLFSVERGDSRTDIPKSTLRRSSKSECILPLQTAKKRTRLRPQNRFERARRTRLRRRTPRARCALRKFYGIFGYVDCHVNVLVILSFFDDFGQIKSRSAPCVQKSYGTLKERVYFVCDCACQRHVKSAVEKISSCAHHFGIVAGSVRFWRQKIKVALFGAVEKMTVFANGVFSLV